MREPSQEVRARPGRHSSPARDPDAGFDAPVDPRLALIAASLPLLLDPGWSVELFRSYDGGASVVVARLAPSGEDDAAGEADDYMVAVEDGALLVSGGRETLPPIRACGDAATVLACLAERIGAGAARRRAA